MKIGTKTNQTTTQPIKPPNEDEEIKLKKVTNHIPTNTTDQIRKGAKRHHRSFNGELVFALEQYLIYLQRETNNLK